MLRIQYYVEQFDYLLITLFSCMLIYGNNRPVHNYNRINNYNNIFFYVRDSRTAFNFRFFFFTVLYALPSGKSVSYFCMSYFSLFNEPSGESNLPSAVT